MGFPAATWSFSGLRTVININIPASMKEDAIQPTPFTVYRSGLWEKIDGTWTLILANGKYNGKNEVTIS